MKALVKSFAIFSVLLSSVALAHEAIEIKSSTPSKNGNVDGGPNGTISQLYQGS